MSKLLRFLFCLGALTLVLAVMALLGGRSGDRGALRKYEAELRANGEKLTFADLTRGRQTNASDSYGVITNAAATLSGARLYPGLLEVRRYVGPGRASVTWQQTHLTWMQSAGPGSGGTWEEFAAQMQAAQATMQKIRDALKEPVADAGLPTNMLVDRRVNFVAIRYAAHWLMGAAENDLHQGRLDAALQDLEALAGLARMERNEYTLVAQMIRVAVAGLGLTASWEALQAPGWTEPQLERLQAAWEPADLVEAVETGFVGERACGYELFSTVRRFSGPQISRLLGASSGQGASSSKATLGDIAMQHLYLPAYKLTSIDGDELFYLKTMQESIRALRLVRAQRPWPEVSQAGAAALAKVNAIRSWPDRFRHTFSVMSIPNYRKASVTALHVEAERQMALAAIALKRCQLRHGRLPPSLEALVPEFLPAAPYDCMSAKPLGYRLKADGSYLLYSVGDDGQDDGGDPGPPPGTKPSLWGGRDAVWPAPATEPSESAPEPKGGTGS